MAKELAEITLDLVLETKIGEPDQGAILVSEDGGKTKIWLPKSQIEWERKNKDNILDGTITVTLPVWLAREKKFAGY